MCNPNMFLAVLLFCGSHAAWADGAPVPEQAAPAAVQKASTTQMVFLAEGLAVVNAGLASANPRTYGGAVLLLSPLALTESHLKASDWVGVGSFAAIGVYDTSAYGTSYSRGRVFAENFVAWNLLYAAILATDHFDKGAAADDAGGHLSIVAVPGDGVRMNYRWAF